MWTKAFFQSCLKEQEHAKLFRRQSHKRRKLKIRCHLFIFGLECPWSQRMNETKSERWFHLGKKLLMGRVFELHKILEWGLISKQITERVLKWQHKWKIFSASALYHISSLQSLSKGQYLMAAFQPFVQSFYRVSCNSKVIRRSVLLFRAKKMLRSAQIY